MNGVNFFSQQPLLPKTHRHKNGGQALQNDGGQAQLNEYFCIPIAVD